MNPPVEWKIPPQIEAAIEKIPAISPTFNKLMEMARNVEIEPIELVNVITIDPVLSGKVIKLVNSAYYGLRNPVDSLAQAVVMLGLNTVRNMTMGTAALDKISIQQKSIALDPEAFWYHCLATAVACKLLAQLQDEGVNEQEVHFLAGLLHDLGKIVLLKAIPETYQKILTECKTNGLALNAAEIARLGYSHAQVGGALAKKWKLNPLLVEVIEYHHYPEILTSEKPLIQRVMIANNLCKQANFGQSGNMILESWVENVSKNMGYTPESLQLIKEQLPEELEKAIQFLGLNKTTKSKPT